MTVSRKQLREEMKTQYIEKLITLLSESDEVLRVKDHEIALPIVDREGNEDFIKITVAIPTGANKGTEPYDGYEMAEDYILKKKEKEEKAKTKAEEKKKKIERDKKYREKVAEMKKKKESE